MSREMVQEAKMKCKNCKHEIQQRVAILTKEKFFEHKPSKELFYLSYGGDCIHPEPEVRVGV